MAQNEMIDQIVGQAAYDQLKQLREDAKATTEEIVKLSQQAKQAYDGLGNASTLKQVSDNTKQAVSANNGLITSVQKLGHTYSVADAIIKNYNGTSEKYIKVAQGVADITEKEAKASESNARAKDIESRMTAALTKEKERLEKAAAKEQAALDKANNEYLKLRKIYNETSLELKGMIVQYGLHDAAVIKLKSDVDKMNASLLLAEKAVGQHQRNVGNYASATLSVSQLIRETPSLAYGLNTYLSALSNNFPILFDQFKLLRAELGSTTKAVKVLFLSMFDFTNLFVLGYSAVMLFTSGIIKFGSELSEAQKKYKEFEIGRAHV